MLPERGHRHLESRVKKIEKSVSPRARRRLEARLVDVVTMLRTATGEALVMRDAARVKAEKDAAAADIQRAASGYFAHKQKDAKDAPAPAAAALAASPN